MRFTSLLYLCLSVTALAAPEGEASQRNSVNWSSLKHALYDSFLPPLKNKQLTKYSQTMSFTNNPLPIPTKTANLDNISAPPRSLIPQIISAVPPTVIVDLVNPARRTSLASEFKAGNTPSWYGSLPTDVKSYLSGVKKQINEGALTATTGLAYQTQEGSTTTTMASSSSTSTSTSEGLAAPVARQTGLGVSAMGALGVVGAALVL